MIKDHKLLFKQFNNIFKSFNPFEKELILYKYFVNLTSKHNAALSNFPENIISLDVLCRILNSQIMSYYISNISYPIQGNYFCYQKKIS